MGAYILAVDDEEGFRVLYRRLLEPAGYEVRTAADANEALRMVKGESPAVAILDIRMPGPSGLWLADQIRAVSPETVMILATSDAAVPATASLKPGIAAYLIKPFEAKTLRDTVTGALTLWASAGGHPAPVAPVPLTPAPDVHRSQPQVYAQAPVAHRAEPARYAGSAPGWSTERRLLWALVLLLAAALIAGVVWYLTIGRQGNLLSRVSAASGVVRVLNPAGKVVMQGSGFFVAPDVFVTAHHVVRGGVSATITGTGQATFRAGGVVGVSLEHDLVLLKTTPASASQLPIAETAPAVGDAIAVYGAPLGLAGTLSTGIVSALSAATPLRIQISAPISPGSSGSPVVDSDGSVIGVAVASKTGGQSLNFAIPSQFLRSLLAGAGAVRPFVAVARGAGDDRERHELVGPVRLATVVTEVHGGQAATVAPASASAGMTRESPRGVSQAAPEAAVARTTRLSFDQLGRLIEQEDSTAGTTTYFTYDDRGRLKLETVRKGEATIATWQFAEVENGRFRAVDHLTGTVRLLEYAENGRVISEVTRLGTETVRERQWIYDTPAWPGVPSSSVASGRVELDAVGNPTMERLPSGHELRYRYSFDPYGNWVVRETLRHDAQDLLVRADRRSIEYWE